MSINSTKTMECSHRRVAKTILGLGILGSLLFGSVAAFGATASSTPAGGPIRIFATPSVNGVTGTILIVGAIGDSGKTLTIDKNGKTNPNGNYVKISLKKGTFEVDSTTLNAAANNMQPTINPMTCSGYISVSDPVTVFDGAGLYTGISGMVKITETYAFILPRFTSGAKKGQCNESNSAAQPIAQYASITGSGTVRFS